MSVDREGLRRAAEEATPGPWTAVPSGIEGAGTVFHDPHVLRGDADFIAAASPDVVLALLDDLAAAEEALGRVEALADRWEQIHTTIAPVLGEPPQGQVIKHAEQLRDALAPTRTPSGPREAQAEEE